MKHVVVVQTAFLGDLFLSLPLLKQIRKLWPSARVSLVCRAGLGSFFLETQLVSQIYEVKKGDSASYLEVQRNLNQGTIDLVIAPHVSLRTALFCLKLKAREKVTFRKPWNFLIFGKRLLWPGFLPEALRQLFLLTPWDTELTSQFTRLKDLKVDFSKKDEGNRLTEVPEWASMTLGSLPTAASTQNLTDWLKEIGAAETQKALLENRVILIFPGSVWATKRWTAEGFLQLATELQRENFHIVWMGGSGEEALARELANRVPGSFVLAGKTSVLRSCQLMLQSRLVVCNDSAASHMAAAMNTPVLSIFGPTILKYGYRPWSSKAFIVERSGLDCRPCGKHGGPKCPIKTHACMSHISVQEVVRQARLILSL
jgi:heptosyltransferase-2